VKDKDEWQEDVNNDKLCTEYLDLVKTVMPNLEDKEKRQIRYQR
jgi:hypothetical protein